jgi:hypothetical protein
LSYLQDKNKRALQSVVEKQEIQREIESKKVSFLDPRQGSECLLNPHPYFYPSFWSPQVKRRETCLESELEAQKAHVRDLEISLKQKSAEHMVAQHETKKILRLATP